MSLIVENSGKQENKLGVNDEDVLVYNDKPLIGAILADSTTIVGNSIKEGSFVKIMFKNPITTTERKKLVINYNGQDIIVYRSANKTLVNVYPTLINDNYWFFFAYSIVNLVFDGTRFIYERDDNPPIDTTYVQYPTTKPPEQIWLTTTWEELNYNGAFFRASGGNADPFIEEGGVLVAQTDLIKTHSITVTGGNHNHPLGVANYSETDETGRGGIDPNRNGAVWTYYTGYSGNLTMTGTYGNARDNPETRPVNYTIRVWKRIG